MSDTFKSLSVVILILCVLIICIVTSLEHGGALHHTREEYSPSALFVHKVHMVGTSTSEISANITDALNEASATPFGSTTEEVRTSSSSYEIIKNESLYENEIRNSSSSMYGFSSTTSSTFIPLVGTTSSNICNDCYKRAGTSSSEISSSTVR